MVYKMKSIITYDEIPIPKCMYTQKNVNVDPLISVISQTQSSYFAKDYISDQVIRLLKAAPKEMTELVMRQDKVLLQLEQLQEHIRDIKKHCNITLNAVNTASKKTINLPSEIVINVSAEHLPVSLSLIQNVLAKYIFLNIKYHIHSTVTSKAAKKVKEFMKLLQVAGDQKNKPSLNIRLIFKDVHAKMELITDSTRGVPIIGEVNALRYLARLIPDYLPYPEEHETDSMLDACHLMQSLSTPVTEKQALLKTVTANMEKHTFLTGENLTIVDVAVYSVLKNCNIPGLNNPCIQEWMQHVLSAIKSIISMKSLEIHSNSLKSFIV